MKNILSIIVLSFCSAAYAQNYTAIIPEPVSLVQGKGTFVIDDHTSLIIPSGNSELTALGNRGNEWIKALTGLTLPVKTKATASETPSGYC